MRQVELVVIGAGPAGLAAAAQARRCGLTDVLVLERNDRPGGILNQCIHDGFGVTRFGEALTGPEYVARFEREARALGVQIACSAMVTELTPDRRVTYVSRAGLETVRAGAVVLSTGCRERTRGAIGVAGTRPAGVYTAGVVQHLVNLQNLSVGRRAVILGSGDIGLIMARRLTLEGVEVVGVLEKLPYCSGLQRNVRQCLTDYGIPLHLSTTVTALAGRGHLTGVIASAVDGAGVPVPGTAREIPCDVLILSVGLIPENELARACGIAMDPATGGALVDASLMTSVPGVFACGNCLHVHDLVDFVSEEAETAAEAAAAFVRGDAPGGGQIPVTAGAGVRYVLPRSVWPGRDATLSLRVREPGEAQRVCVRTASDGVLTARRMARLTPAEMIRLPVCAGESEPLTVELEGAPGRRRTEGDLVCTVCPNGCALRVTPDGDGGWTVEGALCERGRRFAVAEMTAPVRTLTTSIPVVGGVRPMASLRSCEPLPKASLREAVRRLDGLSLTAPVTLGQRVCLGGTWFAATVSVPAEGAAQDAT